MTAKRWKRILLIAGSSVGGLLLFILIFGPLIIGAVVKSQIASALEEKFQAKASIGSVSFSWSGRVELEDLRLVPRNFTDPLVEVKKVDARVRLGSAIGGNYIADVDVVAPRIIVEKGADGKFNYDFPPQPPKESRKKKGEKDVDEKPFVQARIKVRDGEVRIRGRGRETVYRNVAVEARVDTLDKPISYAVSLGDTVKVNGGFDLHTLSGPAAVVLDRFSLKNATGAARAYSDIVELDGTITGTLDYQPKFSGKGRLEIADFRLNDKTALHRLTVIHEGSIDRHTVTIDAGKALSVRAQVDVADTVTADLTGSGDLAELGRLLPLKGDTSLEGTAAFKGRIEAKGDLANGDLAITLSNVIDLHLVGEIRNVLEPSREGELRIESVVRPVELSKWVSTPKLGGSEIRATGVVSLQPGRIGATVQVPAFEWGAVKGSFDSQVTYADNVILGTTTFSNLEVTDEKKNVVKDPGLTIVHEIGLADKNKSIELKKVEVASSFLRGSVTGRILRLGPALEFQKVHFALRYLPSRLGTMAKPWLPGKLEGTEEKVLDLTLEGKASSSKALAVLRGAAGAIDLDLATFTMEGLSLSGKTHLDLKDGRLVSTTPLSVNNGGADLHASLDFNAPEKNPQSTATFNAKDVGANGQMGPILERINPIFHTSGVDAKVDGRIQSDFALLWSGPIDPEEKDWGAAATRSLSGSGVFSVQDLNILGSPVAGQIMAAIGQDNAMKGEVIATQVRISNGRCEYENMLMRGSRKDAAALQRDQEQLAADRAQLEADKPRLSAREHQKRVEEFKQREEELPFRYTLKFTGWVGFDRKMQLRVLMPMTPNLAKSHPGLTKYIGTSFWVDLTGTTDRPRLDVNKMVAEAVKRAAEGVLMDKLDDALKRLLDKKKKDEKK